MVFHSLKSISSRLGQSEIWGPRCVPMCKRASGYVRFQRRQIKADKAQTDPDLQIDLLNRGDFSTGTRGKSIHS